MLKMLAALMFREIPSDPNARRYRLGHSLGTQFTSWRRAKFFGRFRPFFRFHSQRRAIVYVWLNDEHTLRKAGARTDPYAVFAKMLASGTPPDGFDDLLRASGTLRAPHGP
jgi:toxin YhaV